MGSEAKRQKLVGILGEEKVRTLEMVHHLFTSAGHIENLSNEHLRAYDLSSARLRLLVRLMQSQRFQQRDGISPSELSDTQGISRNTVSALLRSLEDQGLIAREVDPDDRRRFLIQLTPKGRELVGKAGPSNLDYVTRMFAGLEQEERETLLRLLQKLNAFLEESFMQNE